LTLAVDRSAYETDIATSQARHQLESEALARLQGRLHGTALTSMSLAT
jgi:hypothetical protein